MTVVVFLSDSYFVGNLSAAYGHKNDAFELKIKLLVQRRHRHDDCTNVGGQRKNVHTFTSMFSSSPASLAHGFSSFASSLKQADTSLQLQLRVSLKFRCSQTEAMEWRSKSTQNRTAWGSPLQIAYAQSFRDDFWLASQRIWKLFVGKRNLSLVQSDLYLNKTWFDSDKSLLWLGFLPLDWLIDWLIDRRRLINCALCKHIFHVFYFLSRVLKYYFCLRLSLSKSKSFTLFRPRINWSV